MCWPYLPACSAVGRVCSRGCLLLGGLLPGGDVCFWGVSALGGVSAPGGGRLLPAGMCAPGGSALGGSAPGGGLLWGGVYSKGCVWSQGGVCSWGSVCSRGVVCSRGCLVWGGCVCSRGCLLPGGCLVLGGVCSQGGVPGQVLPPPVDRHMPVNILPCPKLRLQAVTRMHSSRMRTAHFSGRLYLGGSTSGSRGEEGVCLWVQESVPLGLGVFTTPLSETHTRPPGHTRGHTHTSWTHPFHPPPGQNDWPYPQGPHPSWDHTPPRDHTPRNYKSGRYASYCNAFLFPSCIFSYYQMGSITIFLITGIGPKSVFWHETIIHIKMGIRPQNMPQTSSFLLSPTKSMVARGNQWSTRRNSTWTFKVLRLSNTQNGYNT